MLLLTLPLSHHKKFVIVSLVFLVSLLTAFTGKAAPLTRPNAWDGVSLGGYASEISVKQGENINFHISTDVSAPYTITIWREGMNRQLMDTINIPTAGQHSCDEGYQPPDGCGWPSAHTLNVPTDWPSGVYVVDIPTNAAGDQHIIFWVKEDTPGSTAKTLFLSSVNTYNAYTNFGGKSLYNGTSSDDDNDGIGDKASKVSFNRPFKSNGLGDFGLEKPFTVWAETEGYDIEYAANYDLEFSPNLLTPYDVVVIAGHSEYWTWTMRQRLKAFINNGGRFINLSGNTMWWQVRYEDNGRTLVGYKDYETDPATDPEEETDNPADYPIYDPEYTITGAHWRSGGYFNNSTDPTFQDADGYGGYWVQQPDHWVFENLNLEQGDVFGRNSNTSTYVIGGEVDGTPFNCLPDGRTISGTLPNTGTPSNFTILGTAPVSRDFQDLGFAVMGIYTIPNGGAVFSANSTGWSRALTDSQVSQITKNVFDRFLADNVPQEPNGPETDYFFYDRFNCNNLDHEGVLPSFTGPKWYEGVPTYNYYNFTPSLSPDEESDLRYTNACGIGEGSGLQISIPDPPPANFFSLRSQLNPTFQTTDTLYTRMYLDFSNLRMAEVEPPPDPPETFFLMQQMYDDGVTVPTVKLAHLLVRWEDNTPKIKYRTDFSVGFTQGTDWLEVPVNRPFLLETLFDQPNDKLSVWIDNTRYDKIVGDLSGVSGLNRVDILMQSVDVGTGGSICIDELTFDDTRIGAIPATVLATTPAHGATNVPLNQSIIIDFNRTMDTGAVSYTITPTLVTTPTWSKNDTRLSLTHNGLSNDTAYTAQVTGQDLSGTSLTAETIPNPWQFATGNLTLPEADLSVIHSLIGADQIIAGDTISYTVNLSNKGPFSPVSATLVMAFDQATALAGVNGPNCEWSTGETDVTCAVSNIDDTPSSIIIEAETSESYSGDLKSTVTVEPTSSTVIDSNQTNNEHGPLVVTVNNDTMSSEKRIYLPIIVK